MTRRVASRFFCGKPERPFHLSCTFIFYEMKEIGCRKVLGVSEKMVSPGLPGLQVATHLMTGGNVL